MNSEKFLFNDRTEEFLALQAKFKSMERPYVVTESTEKVPFENGYCYLRLVPVSSRFDAAEQCGKFPKLSKLLEYFTLRKLYSPKINISLILKSGNTLHLAKTRDDAWYDLQDILKLYDLNTVIGGDQFYYGKVLISSAKFRFMNFKHLVIVVVSYLSFRIVYLVYYFAATVYAILYDFILQVLIPVSFVLIYNTIVLIMLWVIGERTGIVTNLITEIRAPMLVMISAPSEIMYEDLPSVDGLNHYALNYLTFYDPDCTREVDSPIRTNQYEEKHAVLSHTVVKELGNYLKDFESGVIIQSADISRSAHWLNSAVRAIARIKIFKSIPSGMRVLMVGASSLGPLDGYVYCNSVLEVRDLNRETVRNQISAAKLRGLFYEHTDLRIEFINSKFDVMILVHVMSVKFEDIFIHAARMGVKKVIIHVIYEPILFLYNRGVLLDSQFVFEKYKENGELYISFVHPAEPHTTYKHKWDNYRKYLVVDSVRVNEFVSYIRDVTDSMPGVATMTFSVSKMPCGFRQHNVSSYSAPTCNVVRVPVESHGSGLIRRTVYAEYIVPVSTLGVLSGVFESAKTIRIQSTINSCRNILPSLENKHPIFKFFGDRSNYFDSIVDSVKHISDCNKVLDQISFHHNELLKTSGMTLEKFLLTMFSPKYAAVSESYAIKKILTAKIPSHYSFIGEKIVMNRQLLDVNLIDPIIAGQMQSDNYYRWLVTPANFSCTGYPPWTKIISYPEMTIDCSDYLQVGNIQDNAYRLFYWGDVVANFSSTQSVDNLEYLLRITGSKLEVGDAYICYTKQPKVVLTYIKGKFLRKDLKVVEKLDDSDTSLNANIYEFYYKSIACVTPIKQNGCFYRALGNANTGVADPDTIKRYLFSGSVQIYRSGKVYGLDEAPIKLIVTQDHCDKCESDLLGVGTPIDQWNYLLNGELTPAQRRIQGLYNRKAEILNLLASSTMVRMKSIYESVLYSIEMEIRLLSRFTSIISTEKIEILKCVADFHLYSVELGAFITQSPDIEFTVAWDTTDFVDVVYDSSSKIYRTSSSSKWLIMSKDVQFLREKKLLDNFDKYRGVITEESLRKIDIKLFDGVPGCGKTFAIRRDHVMNQDLVCTATKAALNDYLDLKGDREFYRTYDSILINGGPTCDVMYADEGLMPHAGDILFCALICHVKKIIVYGDRKQIPFISRLPGFPLNNHKLDVQEIQSMNITHRCPKVITRILGYYYDSIETTSKLEGEIFTQYSVTPPKLYIDYDAVITFTQEEKEEVKRLNPKYYVKTIHEVQGKTFDHVCIVRYRSQLNAIYDSIPHIIVALSRCKVSLTYITCDKTDHISMAITQMANLTKSPTFAPTQSFEPVFRYKGFRPLKIKTFKIFKKIYNKGLEVFDMIRSLNLEYNSPMPDLPFDWNYDLPTLTESIPENVPVELVQIALDVLYDRPDELAQERLRNSNVFPLEDAFNVDWVKVINFFSNTEQYCDSLLITPQPERAQGTFVEVINASRKRNLNPPQLEQPILTETISNCVKIWFETFFEYTKFNDIMRVTDYFSDIWTEDWMGTRKGQRIKALESYDFALRNPSTFASHLKPDLKTPLDNSHNLEMISGQIVTAHHPMITAKFAGVFRCFTYVLKYALKDKWLINDGITSDQLNGFWNTLYDDDEFYQLLEIDMAKFDKSQGERILEMTCEIMRLFRVPEAYIQEWKNCHIINRLVFHKIGVSLKVKYQRRSGDVSTFIGNTIVTMIILSYVYDLKSPECKGGVFGGDDSLILFKSKNLILDKTENIASIFNIVAKIERHYDCAKFASKFEIYAEGVYMFVRDPIKSLIRLGRHDMFCKEHVKQYYVSFCDGHKELKSPYVRLELTKATFNRYKHKFKNPNYFAVELIIEFLTSLLYDEAKFMNLYHAPKIIWERKLPEHLKEETLISIEDLTDYF